MFRKNRPANLIILQQSKFTTDDLVAAAFTTAQQLQMEPPRITYVDLPIGADSFDAAFFPTLASSIAGSDVVIYSKMRLHRSFVKPDEVQAYTARMLQRFGKEEELHDRVDTQALNIKWSIAEIVESWRSGISETKTCPHCGSVVNKRHLVDVDCPVCHQLMLARTEAEALANREARLATYEQDLLDYCGKHPQHPKQRRNDNIAIAVADERWARLLSNWLAAMQESDGIEVE